MAVAILLITVAFPVPSVFHDVPGWLTFVVAPAYGAAALAFGSWWITRRTVNDLRWAIDGEATDARRPAQRVLDPVARRDGPVAALGGGHHVVHRPVRHVRHRLHPRLALGWASAVCWWPPAPTFSPSSPCDRSPPRRSPPAAAASPGPGHHGANDGGVDARLGRPRHRHRPDGGVFALLGNLTKTQLEVAIIITSIATLIFGFILMWILAWLTATPVRVVRAALKRVEDGDLSSDLVVFDGTELGELQRGFNSMVAGLRERERVRDLFGRHVGRDVAAAAELQRPTLGGEERHVAVMFVDIVGSTQLVSTLPPREVVELLNRFFAVIVEGGRPPPRHGQQVRGRCHAGDLRCAGNPGQPG